MTRKLRTKLLTGAASAALGMAASVGGAQAQTVFDGFYVGAAAGYHSFDANGAGNTFHACCTSTNSESFGNRHGDGPIGDVFGGYGMTFSGRFYVGGEIDASYSGAGTGPFLTPEGLTGFAPPAFAKIGARDGYGLSARFGYLINPTLMTYVRIGGRAQRFEVTSTGGDRGQIHSLSNYVAGVTLGGGVEFPITGPVMNIGPLMLRVEYDHDIFRRFDVNSGQQPFFSYVGCCGFQQVHFNPQDDIVKLGLVLKFGAPPPPPPAMQPAAAPVAAPPPAQPHLFIVYFNFDKYDLTLDGSRVIQEAADYYRAHGNVSIKIDGYTDLAGTQAYNLELSRHRAQTVTQAMIKDGVPANVMATAWHGKQNPAVPTADGVREARNRRVEIYE